MRTLIALSTLVTGKNTRNQYITLRKGRQKPSTTPVRECRQSHARRPGDEVELAVPEGFHCLRHGKQQLQLHVEAFVSEAAQLDGGDRRKVRV